MTVADFTAFQAPMRRRDALNVLLQTRGNVCSEVALRQWVRQLGNYNLSAALMRDDIYWLEEFGLLKTHETDGVLFATLLERGRDLVEGDELLDGVAPPDVPRK
jgi:hypothetical protein